MTSQADSGWTCSCCGSAHPGNSMSFGSPTPVPWMMASDDERAQGEINADSCVLHDADGTHYFVRGLIEIPVVDADESFSWGVWVSLSETNMNIQARHWESPDRAGLDPMFGWLCTKLPCYETTTLSLPTNLRTRSPGLAPLIQVDPTSNHPLAYEQVHGISIHRVAEINAELLAG